MAGDESLRILNLNIYRMRDFSSASLSIFVDPEFSIQIAVGSATNLCGFVLQE